MCRPKYSPIATSLGLCLCLNPKFKQPGLLIMFNQTELLGFGLCVGPETNLMGLQFLFRPRNVAIGLAVYV